MHRLFLSVAFFLFAFLFISCGNQVEETQDAVIINPKGNLVMVGGGYRPASVMEKVVELSSDRSILLIPMASSIPDTIGWEQRDQLMEFGASHVEIMMLAEDDKDNLEIEETIRNARGIWFSGGDQNRLMDYFSEGMRQAVIDAYHNGAVIAGTSAGTAVQSKTMITGDENFPQSSRFDAFSQITGDNVIVSSGFGLVDGFIVDQHFVKRNRLNRLINVLADSEYDFIAAGIDEATALWIQPSGVAKVIGESQVVLLDKTESRVNSNSGEPIGLTNMKLHVLPPGATFRWNQNGFYDIVKP